MSAAASPCTDVCKIDDASGLCSGCLRTLDEIAAWSRASNAERLNILAAVAHRRAAHDPQGAGLRGECEP